MSNDDLKSGGQTRSGIPLAPAGERTLRIEKTPARHAETKEIHQRRPLPPVPDSQDGDENAPADSSRDRD